MKDVSAWHTSCNTSCFLHVIAKKNPMKSHCFKVCHMIGTFRRVDSACFCMQQIVDNFPLATWFAANVSACMMCLRYRTVIIWVSSDQGGNEP